MYTHILDPGEQNATLPSNVIGQGHIADAINNDISQTVGCRELILTCSTTPSTMRTKCDLDLQG